MSEYLCKKNLKKIILKLLKENEKTKTCKYNHIKLQMCKNILFKCQNMNEQLNCC